MTEDWEEFLEEIPDKWSEFARKTKAEFNKEMDWVRAEEMSLLETLKTEIVGNYRDHWVKYLSGKRHT